MSAINAFSHVFCRPPFNPFLRPVCLNVLRPRPKIILSNSATPLEPPSTTSKLWHQLQFLPLKTSPTCLDHPESIRRTARETTTLLSRHVYLTACLAYQSAWNHLSPLCLSGACLYPHFSLTMLGCRGRWLEKTSTLKLTNPCPSRDTQVWVSSISI